MNCIVYANINGKLSSIPLEGVSSITDVQSAFNDAIKQISESGKIDELNDNPIYKAVANIYNIISNKNTRSLNEVDDIQSIGQNKVSNYSSIKEIPDDVFHPLIKKGLYILDSEFDNKNPASIKFEYNVDDSTQDIQAHYDPETNQIVLNLRKSDVNNLQDAGLKAIINKLITHEYIHSLLDKNFNPSDENINNTYRQIKEIFKSRGFVSEMEKTYKNTNVRIKEYLAETFTKAILDPEKNKINIEQSKQLKTLFNQIAPDSKQEKSFYKFINSTEFEEESSLDRDLVNAIKNNDVTSEKAQTALGTIIDRFNHNKKALGDTKYDVSYEGAVMRENSTPFNFQLQLGKLEVNDILYIPPFKYDDKTKSFVKDEKSEYKAKYAPIVNSYFDNKKGEQRFVVALEKKDGTFTKLNISSSDVIGFRNNVGIIKNTKVAPSVLKEVKQRYNQDLVFDSVEVKKSQALEGSDKTGLSGNLLTIDIKKGKTIISKDAIEFRMGDNSIQNNTLLRSMNRNSIIQYRITSDGKSKRIHAPIVRVLANGVEALSSEKGTTYFVPFNKIESVITLKEDFLNDYNEQAEGRSSQVFDKYYENKGIRYSIMQYTDKTGNLKPVKNAKYDYNQIFKDKLNHRTELDNFLDEQYKQLSKSKSGASILDHISSLQQSNIRDYAIVYLNRKNLLKSISGDNTYAVYDYIGSDGNQYSGKGKIVHTSNDLIYLYTETAKGGFIQKINIRNNVASQYNPCLRRVLYDNTSEYNLTKQFNNQKNDIRSNYEEIINLFSKENVSSRNAKLKQIEDNQQSELNGAKTIPTSLSDYYYYEYFNDQDLDPQQLLNKKAFLLSKITPGCIVFRERNGYTNAVMVTGVNQNTGAIIVSNIITEAKGDKAYWNGTYIKEELNPDEVKHIGYNIYDNDQLGIKANPHFSKKYDIYSKKIKEFNDIKHYNSEESVNKMINSRKNKSDLSSVKLAEILDNETGKFFYLESDKLKNIQNNKRYTVTPNTVKFGIKINYKDGSFLEKQSSSYFNVKGDVSSNKKAYNLLEEGDVVSLTDKYWNMIVTNKLPTKDGKYKYKVESYYINKDGVQKNIIKTLTENDIKDIKRFNFNRFDSNREKANPDVFGNIQDKGDYNNDNIKSQSSIPYSKETSGYNKSVDEFVHIQSLADNLSKKYGVQFKLLTSKEIANIYDGQKVFSDKRAFVIGDEAIINSDLASLAEPLHELTHFILPQLKKMNLVEYTSLLNAVRSHPDYNIIAKSYPELSGRDLDEEVFCTIFGENYANKIRSNQGTDWNNKNKSWFGRIFDKVKQFFSNLFGVDIKTFDVYSPKMFMNMSLNDMIDQFGDNLIGGRYENMVDSYKNTFNNKIDRMVQTLYSKELIKKECYG